MKINPIFSIIAFIMAGLIGLGFYSGNSGDMYQILITVVSSLMIFASLMFLLAVSGPNGISANIKIVGAIFLIIFLAVNVVFSIVNFSSWITYIIVNGILFLIGIIIEYSIIKALK